MVAATTRGDSPRDFIVVWKLQLFSKSLEETIELRDKLRRVGTKLVSTTEKGVDDYLKTVARTLLKIAR